MRLKPYRIVNESGEARRLGCGDEWLTTPGFNPDMENVSWYGLGEKAHAAVTVWEGYLNGQISDNGRIYLLEGRLPIFAALKLRPFSTIVLKDA